ncbi:MAG TPA: hypothetical protein VK618_11695, partial [Flavitalea sp.]|nr:hypothetical protein [Flavitalea sp.]
MRRILPKDNFEVYQSPFELRKIINYEKRKTYVIGKGKFKGAWYHDPTDTTSDDNLGLVLVNAADERLRRIVTDSVNNQWFGGAEVFFSSAAAANAAIPEDFRFQGLSLLADDGSSVTEYWYRDGIEDEDLVVKSSGEGGSSTFEGLTDRPPSEANQYFRRNGTNDGTVFTYLEYGRQVVSTAADTVLAGVEVVICNYNTAPVALTMRPVAEWENRKLTIINIAADESIGLIEADEIFPGHSGTVPPMTAYTFFSDGTYAYLESTSAVGDGEGPAADGSETKIDVVEDSGLLIDGSGTIGDPYILDLDFDPLDVTQTHYAAGVNVNFSDADGTALDPIVVSAVLGGSGNILKGLNIEAYGGVANYSSVGTVMGGTNNSPALTAMIAAAADGQLIVIPHGRWYFASTVIIPASKRVNLLVLGDVFCLNGFLQWAPLSIIGHEVRIKGAGYGKLGLTGFTKADFDNGTGMNATSGTGVKWSSLTSNFIEFNDTHHSLVQMGYVAGFNAAFCHNAGGTANHGGQENTI